MDEGGEERKGDGGEGREGGGRLSRIKASLPPE